MHAAARSMFLLAVVAAGALPSTALSTTNQPPKGSGDAGTRDNPYAVGSTFDVPTWRLTVDSVDPDAWPKIQAANTYNEPPVEGHQFVMFHVIGSYTGEESGSPVYDLTWSILGPTGDSFGTNLDDYCGLLPDALSDQGEVYTGAMVAGNVCVSVASDQIDGAVIQLDEYLQSAQAFIATQPGQGTAAPSPEATVPPLATPDPSAERGTRANPYAVGDEVVLSEWKVTVDSIDADAWPEIEQVNTFNDPPADGRHFVMFHVTATNTGTEPGNPSLNPSWAVVGSSGNTFGASLTDYCGVIPDALNDQGDAGQLASGESASGNICVSVPTDQLDGAIIRIRPSFDDPAFVALS